MPGVDPVGNADYTYVQAANVIAVRIEAGEFTRRLPAERDLARELGVAYQTLRHSMKVLRDRGLIITRQGRGTFVEHVASGTDISDGRRDAARTGHQPSSGWGDRMKPGLACITTGHLRGGCAFKFSCEGLTPVTEKVRAGA